MAHMTDKERLIKARLAVLTLAAEVKNVVKVCKLAGLSRSQFYAMKKAYDTYGKEGLAPLARRKPVMPNRTPALLEEWILLNTWRNPAFGCVRLAMKMESLGTSVSPTMVRYVWQRHSLSTRSARMEWAKQNNKPRRRREPASQSEGVAQHPSFPTRLHFGDSFIRSPEGLNSPAAKNSRVNWTYWSERVRETLTKS